MTFGTIGLASDLAVFLSSWFFIYSPEAQQLGIFQGGEYLSKVRKKVGKHPRILRSLLGHTFFLPFASVFDLKNWPFKSAHRGLL